MTARCAVFARWMTSDERKLAAKGEPSSRVASALAVSLQVTLEDASVMLTSGVMAGVTIRNGSAPDQVRVSDDQRFDAAMADPLVTRGADYTRLSWPVLRGLRPLLKDRRDAIATDAAERLEEICITVASKVYRAVSSSFEADHNAADPQNDANGSAKVALILIDESRRAWRVLMQPGRAIADGVPARLVAALDGLEAALLQRFPRALEFLRPGFDTVGLRVGNTTGP